MEKELINAQVLAEALGLSVETIWRYTREKKIPYLELGNKQYRYRLQEVILALTGSGSIREKAPGFQADPDRIYTYQDYLELPHEPGYRYEVLDGVLVKDPSPNLTHQRIASELFLVLKLHFRQSDPQGEVLFSPLDVTLGERTVVQPDILYMRGDQKQGMLPERIDGPPYMVIEIVSPATERKDRLRKYQLYQGAGVQHYWLVKAEDRTLECYSLHEGAYVRIAFGMDEDVLNHPAFPGLTIAMADLWPR